MINRTATPKKSRSFYFSDTQKFHAERWLVEVSERLMGGEPRTSNAREKI